MDEEQNQRWKDSRVFKLKEESEGTREDPYSATSGCQPAAA